MPLIVRILTKRELCRPKHMHICIKDVSTTPNFTDQLDTKKITKEVHWRFQDLASQFPP